MLLQRLHYPMKSDVREKKDSYLLEIDLPGCQKEDISAYVENGFLVVHVKIHEEKEKKSIHYLRKERYHGEFHRSFYIGSNISQDDIKASYKRGILKLLIPKEDNCTQKINIA